MNVDILDLEPEDQPVASTQAVSAFTLLNKSHEAQSLLLQDARLDALFQPSDSSSIGLPVNHVLEICSPPGFGKSRWALLSAIRYLSQQPHQALFIDTEGHASPEMIEALAKEVCAGDAEKLEHILINLHYMRITRQDEFLALVLRLQHWLEVHPQVRLIVIDCLSAPLRFALFPILLDAKPTGPDGQNQMRANVLKSIKLLFSSLCALQDGYTFVVTTQMSTKFDMMGQSVLESQLGNGWQPRCCFQVVLYADSFGDKYKIAHLAMSPYQTKVVNVKFVVQSNGMLQSIDD